MGDPTQPNETRTASAGPVVETRALTKRYGSVTALDGVDLSVPHGATGLLGANGAGKTTLIRLLLGLAQPTSGTAAVLGHDSSREGVAVRARVGYMPESDALPSAVTAADFVAHMGEMSGLPARAARQRANDVLYQVGLDEERYRLVGGFSTGMKQRVKLAQAIVHDPALVFLDEPTNGMDPRGRDEMLELIRRIDRQMGIAVVLSSHILDDIERVCEQVVILDRGRLVAAQPIGEGLADGHDIVVRVDGDRAAFVARLAALGRNARPTGSERASDEVVVAGDDPAAYDAIRDAAADLGCAIRALSAQTRSLEDVYFGSIAGPADREARA